MLDPDFLALQAAMMHTMLLHNPELREEVIQLQEFYKENYFMPGDETQVYLAMRGSFNHMMKETAPGGIAYLKTNKPECCAKCPLVWGGQHSRFGCSYGQDNYIVEITGIDPTKERAEWCKL